ncbi:MAG TPA: hypothetical protein VF326_06110 [Anaerolineaceae bacterium]|jgi:hypothetical protein
MRIITNEPLIKRNRIIGQVTTVGSLLVLAGGLYLSFQSSNPQLINYSFLALLAGFLLSQVGIYFGNRWGRHPRPDEQISAGLKGLEDKYTVYHYTTPASHLLVGPAGVWVLFPYGQAGTISYVKNRWKQKGGNWYLKLFAQDTLGRPDLEVTSALSDMKRFLVRKMPEVQIPDIQALLVFTNDKVTLAVEETPVPAVKLDRLKDTIRKEAKTSRTSPELISAIVDAIEQ